MTIKKTSLCASITMGTALVVAASLPSAAQARGYHHYNHHQSNRVVVYFTRHAEKKTTTESLGPALMYSDKGDNLDEVCGVKKCAEELNALGLKRAELLSDWFERRGITYRLTHAFSSHKKRTLQTILPTINVAMEVGVELAADNDKFAGDGIQEFPAGTELNPESTSGSMQPLVDALQSLDGGSVVLVAGHSGTLYKIMGEGDPEKGITGLGIDTSSDIDFPRNEKGKVRDFGDIWKVVINTRTGVARLAWRKNLEFGKLRIQRNW